MVKALYPAQSALQREINPLVLSPEELTAWPQGGDSFIRELQDKPKLFVIGDADDLGKLARNPQTAAL